MQKDDVIYRQAAIEALHQWFADGFEEDRWWNSTHVLAALEGLPSAQPEQRWIPCSERLPKYGEPVLWCNEKGSVFTTAITFVNERGDFAVGKRHRRYSVVAWKPLPEPYKGE